MDFWLFSPCSPSLRVWTTMNHIGIGVRRLSLLSLTSLTLVTHFDGKKSLNSLQIRTNSHSNTLLLFSKAKLHKWGLRGRKWGLYKIYRLRETQGLPNKWFIILRKHYSTFAFATINTPFWYPTLADGYLWIALSDWDEVWKIISWDTLGGNPISPISIQ
jgi:hypothetical protein